MKAAGSGPRVPPTRLRLLRGLGVGFHVGAAAAALSVLSVVIAVATALVVKAGPSIQRTGFGFVTGSAWDGVRNQYGALPEVVGTLVSSGLALLLAVPVALGVAVFLSETAPPWVRRPLTYLVDLSAAVPSVVYGFWAFDVLRPWMRSSAEPTLQAAPGGAALFGGLPTGTDLLTATLVLAVMILPTIAAVTRESLQAVSRLQRESALSLGATRWEATRLAVLGPARSGIAGGIILGLGRALGETIAVAMIIGNVGLLPTSLIAPAQTLASQIANNFSDVGPGPQQSALVELGVLLLAITVAVNVLARLLIWGLTTRGARPRLAGPSRNQLQKVAERLGGGAAPVGATLPAPRSWRGGRGPDAERRRWRRRSWERVVLAVSVLCVAIAVAPLASVLLTASERGGAAVIQPSFYSAGPPIPCSPAPGRICTLGGIGPEIEGTVVLLGLAALVAVPVGLFAGIYVSEYARGRETAVARVVSFLADVMTGIPTILIGVVVYLAFLSYDSASAHSSYSGGLALGLVMVPIVTRATEEALRSVPDAVREAGLALGYPRHRVAFRVVLGTARSAIVTGILLALSRAAGDTAALIVTAGGSLYYIQNLGAPVGAITPFIWSNFQSSALNYQTDAWGAALVLLAIMLSISLGARLVTNPRGSPAPGG